jgi:hypothetical protein
LIAPTSDWQPRNTSLVNFVNNIHYPAGLNCWSSWSTLKRTTHRDSARAPQPCSSIFPLADSAL